MDSAADKMRGKSRLQDLRPHAILENGSGVKKKSGDRSTLHVFLHCCQTG